MTEIQLDIIRTFGSKELSEGCLINTEHWERKWDDYFLVWDESLYRESRNGNEPYLFSKTFTILWHIPHLEDVFRVLIKEKWHMHLLAKNDDTYEIWITRYEHVTVKFPYNPTLSLLDQSEETLTQLLNLFK